MFSSTLKGGFQNVRIRCRIRRMRVDGRRIRKEKLTDLKNIQIRVDGDLFFLSSYCRAIEAVNREFTIWRLEVRSEKIML